MNWVQEEGWWLNILFLKKWKMKFFFPSVAQGKKGWKTFKLNWGMKKNYFRNRLELTCVKTTSLSNFSAFLLNSWTFWLNWWKTTCPRSVTTETFTWSHSIRGKTWEWWCHRQSLQFKCSFAIVIIFTASRATVRGQRWSLATSDRRSEQNRHTQKQGICA